MKSFYPQYKINYTPLEFRSNTEKGFNFTKVKRYSALALLQLLFIFMLGQFQTSIHLPNTESANLSSPQVLGKQILPNIPQTNTTPQEISMIEEILIPPLPTQEPSEKPTPKKDFYTIAVYGDSMIDTSGERNEYLEKALQKYYPNTKFILFNYGKGSENAYEGLLRFHNSFKHQDRNYPSLDDVSPDIIIMGSYAYNVYTPHDRNQHWIDLTRLLQEAIKITPNVYILAEIAPLRSDFGKGYQGVNWDTNTVYTHSRYIIEQLENAVGLSTALQLPLIDVYHQSIANPELKEGDKKYINPVDNIHPSVEGHEFIADIIAQTIELDK